MATPSIPVPERSVGQLVADLSHQISTLFRQELQLAKTELSARAQPLVRDVVVIGAGVALASTALTTGAATLVLALIAADLRPWVAALAVTLALLVVGGVTVLAGVRALKRRSVVPVTTIASVKETAQWIKQETTGQ